MRLFVWGCSALNGPSLHFPARAVHLAETIPYLVIEAGTWYTDGGRMIQAGRVTASGADTSQTCCSASDSSCCVGSSQGTVGKDFTDVPFHTPFPDNDVSIITQVQTYNDVSFVKTRTHALLKSGVNQQSAHVGDDDQTWSTGFSVSLEREKGIGNQISQQLEQIGYVAFQHTSEGDTLGGDLYMADQTDMSVTDSPTGGGINFCVGFENPPLFFASIATYEGWDSAELRLAVPTTNAAAAVYIEEEGCSDDETTHIPEVVSFFALQHSTANKIRATATAPRNVGAPPQYGWSPGEPECGAAGVYPTHCAEGDTMCWDSTAAAGASAPAQDCAARFQDSLDVVNSVCCADKGACSSGSTFPTKCSDDCSGLWMPIWENCKGYVQTIFSGDASTAASINKFSAACATTLYGGSCTDDYWTKALAQVQKKCTSTTTCSKTCRKTVLPVYSACKGKLAAGYDPSTTQITALQALCSGGGH